MGHRRNKHRLSKDIQRLRYAKDICLEMYLINTHRGEDPDFGLHGFGQTKPATGLC
jgi:hypothetical protein